MLVRMGTRRETRIPLKPHGPLHWRSQLTHIGIQRALDEYAASVERRNAMSETVTAIITRVYEAQAREAAAKEEQRLAIERIAFSLALPPRRVRVEREPFCVRDGRVYVLYEGRWIPESSERVVDRREDHGVLVSTATVYGFGCPSYESFVVRPLTSEREGRE